jgi:hypothetical protein
MRASLSFIFFLCVLITSDISKLHINSPSLPSPSRRVQNELINAKNESKSSIIHIHRRIATEQNTLPYLAVALGYLLCVIAKRNPLFRPLF